MPIGPLRRLHRRCEVSPRERRAAAGAAAPSVVDFDSRMEDQWLAI